MNDYLKAAVARDKSPQYKIQPLSEINAEVIQELIIILGKLNQPDLKEILSNYKYLSDEEIRDQLLDWNINYTKKEGEEQNEEATSTKGRGFIDLMGNFYEVQFILSIERTQRYDFTSNGLVYSILINRTDSTSLFYANTTIDFKSIKQRDEEVDKLKAKLKLKGVRFI